MLRQLSNFSLKKDFLNILFSLIPLSFIVGNTMLNLNIFLLSISTIIFYNSKIIKLNFYLIDKIFLIFFSFTLITGILNNITSYYILKESLQDYTLIIKTLSYLRFLIFYFIIRYLVESKLINFKLFFISCSFFSLFVVLDIFYQFSFGEDIFGYKNVGEKLSGPFGDELIAGSFLQRFSPFSFFLFPLFFKMNKNILYFIIPVLFVIFFSGIVISGNRMPLILFLSILILITFFEKKTRKYFILFFATASILFAIIYNLNTPIKHNFNAFFSDVTKISKILISGKESFKKTPGYYHEFESFYDTWLMHKYIGGGIKSFRFNCPKRLNVDQTKGERTTCNTHPHNYYLEILAELGLVGFVLLSSIFLMTLYISFVKKYITNTINKFDHTITPFIFLFLAEIFPVRSSGSFFTTGNSTFIFLVMAVTIALSRSKKLN